MFARSMQQPKPNAAATLTYVPVLYVAIQAAVAGDQSWKATAVQLLALLLSGAERSELLAGCSSL